MKVVCGLGNPGAEYALTRHNVGWWLVEALQQRWSLPEWQRQGIVRYTQGHVDEVEVGLIEPLTYMNRSGAAMTPLLGLASFEPSRDLLVVVDDVALDVGRARFRAQGSSGGHNGLRSVEDTLGSQAYARLRIGVGAPPAGVDLATWVLSPFGPAEEERVRDVVAELVDGVRAWLDEGVDAAIRFNR
jgi:peptidyl-tRNA hydrolase, PTH1 family